MKPGQLIKNFRLEAKMTQLELAQKLGYTIPQFISLMENGHSKVPLELAPKLINIFALSKTNTRIFAKAFVSEYEKIVLKKFKMKESK